MISKYYEVFKSIHIISIIFWVSCMFFIPLLFYRYLKETEEKNNATLLLRLQEFTIKNILNPSIIISIITGLLNSHIYGFSVLGLWFYLKMCIVLAFLGLHGFYVRTYKRIINGYTLNINKNTFFYLSIFSFIIGSYAVMLVVIKPFE